jgi:hypothetical protein
MLGNFTIGSVVKTHSMGAHFGSANIDVALNLGGPLKFSGKGEMIFGNFSGGFRFDGAGGTVAEIANSGASRFRGGLDVGPNGAYRIAGAIVLPNWVGSYAGGDKDKSVQLASGTGAASHLPSYDATGGLIDSGKTLVGAGNLVPAVGDSMGCLDGWDHLPCTVAKLPPKTMTSTSSTPPTTLFTTAAPLGVYQVTVTFHSLGGASSGTGMPVAVLGQFDATGTAASMTNRGSDCVSSASITLEEGSGVALGYALNLSNVQGAARYVISMEVIRLQ